MERGGGEDKQCASTLRTVVPRGAAGGALSLYLLSVPVSWVGVVGAEAQHRRVLAQWATFITGGRFAPFADRGRARGRECTLHLRFPIQAGGKGEDDIDTYKGS
jgi:hypothetical protein